jgi:hypothetical protein
MHMTDSLKAPVVARAAAAELPLLRLQTLSGLSSVGFGLACGAVVALLMLLPVAIHYPGDAAIREILGSALFFGSSIGIVAGCSTPVFRGAGRDLRDLGPVIGMSDEHLETLTRAVTRSGPRGVFLATTAGVVAGLLHSELLGAFNLPAAYATASVTATVLLWVVMNWSVPFLIRNALLFADLGRQATPDLLRPTRHAGFGAAALRPALFIIAVLCAYPLLLIGDENGLRNATLLGVAASVISLPLIFALPLRGIRRRIREQRTATLSELDRRLDQITGGDIARSSAEDLFELDAVLDMRERVARAPAWPLDLAGVRRILLYVVLPPLTWAAAAIVEMLIDNAV